MPKIVDHDVQRAKFAEAAMRLIARFGLEGVTMRAVAAEAGLSYGSLFHYFDSKDELLMHATRLTTSLQTKRANEFTSRYSGLKALQELLCDDAIINDSSRDSWMVWQTFLYKVALQTTFAEMHADLIDGWLARIRRLLVEAQHAGEPRGAGQAMVPEVRVADVRMRCEQRVEHGRSAAMGPDDEDGAVDVREHLAHRRCSQSLALAGFGSFSSETQRSFFA